MRPGWRLAGLAAATLVVASPALRTGTPDSFPLSTYPMFAGTRERTVSVATAVGRTDEDGVVRLDPETIAASDEVMLAAETVRRAIDTGDGRRLCREVADRLTGEDEILTVELRSETYDALDYFDGDTEPVGVTVHTRCPTARR